MAQFFDYPLNYGPGRAGNCPEYIDNDYNTYREGASHISNCTFNISPTGSADAHQNPLPIESTRPFTHIFIKTKGVSRYNINFSGVIPSTFAQISGIIPLIVRNDSEQDVDTTIDDIQHHLIAVPFNSNTPPRAVSITIRFDGSNIRVYQVMILNEILNLATDGVFSKLEYDSMNLGSNQEDIRRRMSYVPPIGNERDKWLVNYSALSMHSPLQVNDNHYRPKSAYTTAVYTGPITTGLNQIDWPSRITVVFLDVFDNLGNLITPGLLGAAAKLRFTGSDGTSTITEEINIGTSDRGCISKTFFTSVTRIELLTLTGTQHAPTNFPFEINYIPTTLGIPRRFDEKTADKILNFIRKYKTFTFAPEYTRYPDRVFPAVWPQSSTQIRYLSRSKAAGRRINFSVREL